MKHEYSILAKVAVSGTYLLIFFFFFKKIGYGGGKAWVWLGAARYDSSTRLK